MSSNIALVPANPSDDSNTQLNLKSGLLIAGGLAFLLIGLQLLSTAFSIQLTNDQYGRPYLLLEMVRYSPQVLVVAATCGVLAFAGGRSSWHSYDNASLLRFFIAALCFIIAWAYSGYAMNHFHGHLHLSARLALIALACLTYYHPAALPAFLATAYMIAHQFEGDLPGSYTWNDKRTLFHVLTLFTAYQIWKLITRQGVVLFWTACLSLVAAYYFQAGFNKATLPSWVSSNVLANFIFASHVGGWFYSHDSETALRALNMIRLANPLMIATTLIIELGSVFILSNRRVALALLAGFMLLHSLIFMLMGILFWKWLCMDACLLIVVWRMKAPLAMELFSRKNFGFGVATTAGILIFMQPWGQGSLNTPLAATYRFEAVGESGERYSLSSDFFAPYDVIFAQRRFYCLSDQAPVVSTFGSTKNPSLFREIGQAGPDAVQIAKIIDDAQTNGNAESTEDAANPQLAAQFDQFVTRFVQAKLNAGESAIAERIGPFHHILQSPGGEGLAPYDWQEPIARVDVYEVQKFYDTQAIHTLKDQLCHQVEVGSADEFVARVRQQPSEVRPR